jgi:hypothetical protein
MIRTRALTLLIAAVAFQEASHAQDSTNKVLSKEDFGLVRNEIETLRGKKFRHNVPVYKVSDAELRSISDRALEKQYPGEKLHSYEELLAWMDVVPPGTDLKAAYAKFLVNQVAGLYDDETGEMCIPTFAGGITNVSKKAAEKKIPELTPALDEIVLAHEYTHALEDQYWPLNDPKDNDTSISTDRGVAHGFLAEGSATRQMIEALPSQFADDTPEAYFLLWNLLHAGFSEWLLDYALGTLWKSSDATVPGVPEVIARSEAMPYSFGYSFCTKIMRDWGLDGLDYIYEHPPASSEQVMHAAKCWEWRDFPVQINMPESLPGGWDQTSIDCVGEAGMAVLFGSLFENLSHGLTIGEGWDGDHTALYTNADGKRLLIWASSWDSARAAARFMEACVKSRRVKHQAEVAKTSSTCTTWTRPDGRAGTIIRTGKQVILLETDRPDALDARSSLTENISFIQPPEDELRASANSDWSRLNPLWSFQQDGDFTVTRTLCGILSRHDRNAIGASDKYLLGALGESRRTESLNKWKLGGGLVAHHESEARRGYSKTVLLPWGVLASHSSAKLPHSPEKTISRTSVIWGLGGGAETNANDVHSVHVLPLGILYKSIDAPGRSSTHVLWTGVSHRDATATAAAVTRFRLLGIPIYTKR